ncbi:S-layer family protein [Ferruginibacter sp. HRS2-29]|uniref:beta strand repeat-containing protein n=1 Tax=Ferruginibacter sp. HRS2-29 TaxID=2487334 RepID=UPI0020CCC5D7|nr:MBG domain-containing protein [Ferruginibacter sp. HRS2-29]MCP9749456.1 hypothetical protein [Ferruginibacter sp. HRS2-29]
MKKFLLTFVVMFAAVAAFSQTYYWVGGTGPVSFTSNGNWNTALNGSGTTRGAASASDILIIDGTNIGGTVPTTGTVTATISSTTLGQLKITGNANVFFQRPTGGGGTGTMTVSGAAGDDFVIDAGSSLTINSPLADGSVVIALPAGSTGNISGNLSLSNTAQHRITNQTAGGFVFNSGATFTTNLTPASAVYAFGSSTQSAPGSVVFLAGANLIFNGGYSPLGNNSTFSAVDLRPGSNWHHRASNAVSGFGSFAAGKGYGNLLVENGASFLCDGPLYRIGTLNVESGATFRTHTSGQTAVLGDLIINGTYTTNAGTNVLVLGGSGTQTISGTGDIIAPSIIVGDNSSVVLNRSLEVNTLLNDFGDINFNTSQVTGTGTFTSRTNTTAAALNGNFVAGSYQVTGITGTMGSVNGLTVTGAGIPANTTVVGSSPANATINLSQPVTAAGTGVALAFLNDTATLATSHANGMDTLTGSVVVTGTKSFQSGTNYIINAATTTPFGISSGSTNTFINAGFVEINAPVTANRGITLLDHLGINAKLTLRPLDTVHIVSGASITGAFGLNNYIATTANTTTGDQGIIQYDGLATSAIIPVGTASDYLPVTLNPVNPSAFTVAAFEGITTNGTVTGTTFTPSQKQSVVNAVWNINRITGTGNVDLQLGWQPGLEGSTFTTLPGTDIGIIYNNGVNFSQPLAPGDNVANIAAATVTGLGAYAIGSVPPTQPFIFNTLPVKTYGNADFNGGAVSLNTTQPIVYSSDNNAVATIVNGDIHITGAGTAVITASQASDGFYPAASATQTLTVNKAPLTITAENKIKFFSAPVPVLTFTYSAFAYAETEAVLLTPVNISTSATAASPVGDYPIVVNGATAANYDITFVNAILSVQAQQAQTITFNTLPLKNYGNADFAIGATSTNNTIPLTYVSSNTNVATIVGTSIHIVGAGTSNITVSQAGNLGYTPATDVTRTLTVNKVPLTIRVRDTAKVERTENPAFTITYTGFVLGETVANLTTPPVVSTIAGLNSAPGYYVLTPTGATSGNYNITTTNGRLTIFPATDTTQQYLNVFMTSSSNMTVRVYSPRPRLGDITLVNMAGQTVFVRNLFMPKGFINSFIDMSRFPSGIYVVVIRGDGVYLKKTVAVVK